VTGREINARLDAVEREILTLLQSVRDLRFDIALDDGVE